MFAELQPPGLGIFQAGQTFHPFGVGELIPDLFGLDEMLTSNVQMRTLQARNMSSFQFDSRSVPEVEVHTEDIASLGWLFTCCLLV